MKIKILVFGEGVTDVGTFDYSGKWINGPIIYLLTRVNNNFEIEPIAKKNLPTILPMKLKPTLEGHGKLIQKMFLYAYTRKIKYDIMVYYGDTDKEASTNNTKTQARKASKSAYNQAHLAFDKFEIRGIAIIPLRMLESWLLADEKAFTNAFGKTCTLPTNPELLWGDKRDPTSNHPKRTLERILTALGLDSNTATFCNIFSNSTISTLEAKCPISFPPFLIKAKEYLINQ